MNLKDEMMKEYQGVNVPKTLDVVKGDISIQMKNGQRHSFQEKARITEDVQETLEKGGFIFEDYEDEATRNQQIKMIKISW